MSDENRVLSQEEFEREWQERGAQQMHTREPSVHVRVDAVVLVTGIAVLRAALSRGVVAELQGNRAPNGQQARDAVRLARGKQVYTRGSVEFD